MSERLPYPPPWQDCATLCAHLCISERTVDAWVRQGILPPSRMRGGKRMWKWSEVESYMEGRTDIVPQDLADRIRHATREAANG